MSENNNEQFKMPPKSQEGQWDVAPEWSQKRPGISRALQRNS